MKFVIIESPFAPKDKFLKKESMDYKEEVNDNLNYARECVNYLLKKNMTSFASHLYFTQDNILDDTIEKERMLGINAGLEIAKRADKSMVFIDYGVSNGMIYGIKSAIENNRPIEIAVLDFHKLNQKRTVATNESFKVLENNFSFEQVKEWVMKSENKMVKLLFTDYTKHRELGNIANEINNKIKTIQKRIASKNQLNP